MRIASSFLLALALTLPPPRVHAQQTAQPMPQRDPQAVAVLSQMIAATGWNPAGLPQDAVASGTVTRYRADSQDTVPFALKIRRPGQGRIELQDPASPTTTIINGPEAAVTNPTSTRAIPFRAALSMQPMTLPFFSKLLSFGDSSVDLRFAGTEPVNSQLAYRVEMAQQVSLTGPLASAQSIASRMTIWIATQSGLPLQIEYHRVATDNPSAIVKRTSQFSDYRIVGGLAVPFHQEEFARGNRLYSLQLASVRFNVGLTDGEFVLPTVQP